VIAPHREVILEKWRDAALGSYPKEGAAHMRRNDDPFANPVGAAVAEATAELLDGLCAGRPPGEMETALDRILRPRAIQDMSPSEAVAFIVKLKDIVRETVPADSGAASEFDEFAARVDLLILVAFDVFVKCREEVFSIRINEIRSRSLKAFERLNEWQARKYGPEHSG